MALIDFLKKPGVMLFGGAVGFLATNVLTSMGTARYLKTKEQMEYDPTLKEELVLIAKTFGPAVAIGAISTGLIFGGNKSYATTQAGLVSAYTLLNTRYAKHKEAISNALKPDDIKELENFMNKPIVEEAKKHHPANGNIIVCDTYGSKEPRFVETTMEEFINAEYQINRILSTMGCVGFDDWCDFLGFDHTITGTELGWNLGYLYDVQGTCWIDFEHELVLEEDGNQYYILKFSADPIVAYREF